MTAGPPTPSTPTPAEQGTIEGSPVDEQAQGRINKQCFLIKNIEQLMNLQVEKTPTGYQNFSCLTGDPLDITNELVSIKGIQPMFDLTAAQHAVLQPRLRLFMIKDGETIEMPFDASLSAKGSVKKTSIQEMVKSSNYRGSGAGIESFTYELAGATPATADRLITAKLKLYFKSIGDLFADRASVTTDGGEAKFQYADLINTKKASLMSSRTPSPASAATASTASADKNRYSLKIVAGWGDPPIGHPLFSRSMREAIKQAKATFSLQLIDHVIKYNQDGTLELDIEYMASIDYKFGGSSLDILWLPESEELKKLKEEYNIAYNTTLTERRSQESRVKRAGEDAAKKARAQNPPGLRGGAETSEERENRIYNARKAAEAQERTEVDADINDRLEQLQEQAENLEEVKKSRRSFTYRRIIEELIGPPDKPEKSKLYEIEVSPAEIGKIKDKTKSSTSTAPRAKGTIKKATPSTATTKYETVIKLKPISEENNNSGKIKIYYFFLGDLINGAIRILKSKIIQGGQEYENIEALETLRTTSILIGPATIKTGSKVRKIGNMADIPISFDLFQQWFVHHVYKPNKDSYLLRDFIKDLMNNLVAPAFGQGCYTLVKQKATVGTLPLRVPRGSDGYPRIKPRTRCKLYNILRRGSFILGSETVTTSLREEDDYLYFFMNDNSFQKRKADELIDTQNGVYHLRIGADKGLVKSIEFKKTDIPFLRESRITNDADTEDGFLREKYDATIVMVGNTFFFPGQYIYIIPTVPGYGGLGDKYKLKLRTLGFGGYYLITKVDHSMTPNSYETELEARWVAFGQEEEVDIEYVPFYMNRVSNCDLAAPADQQLVSELLTLEEENEKAAEEKREKEKREAERGTGDIPGIF